MPHEVKLPQMGESVAEGTVTTWLKKVGERVERDEPLFEISTDKVDAEVPSPVAGVLAEIRVQPGETVPVDSVVAVVSEQGAGVAPEPSRATPEHPTEPAGAQPLVGRPAAVAGQERAEATAPAPAARREPPRAAAAGPEPAISLDERRRTRSSPVVRRIAAEHDVEVASLTGTGAGGRVTKEDILAEVDRRSRATPEAPPPAASPPAAAPATATRPAARAAPVDVPEVPGTMHPGEIPAAYRPRLLEGDRVEELSTIRAKIAEHMTVSRQTSAHVQTIWDVDMSHVAALRAQARASWAEKHGVNLTYTAFIMKATVDALKAFPVVNASIAGRRVIYHRDINLGLAVALDWGLIVPVIHQAGDLNLLGLARRAQDLAERARAKRLTPDDVQNGTFSITNPGVFGSMVGLPIINQPQVAILAVGTVEKRPVAIDDMIAVRTRAYLSLSFDHRLIDGAVADQFMARVKKGLEELDAAEL